MTERREVEGEGAVTRKRHEGEASWKWGEEASWWETASHSEGACTSQWSGVGWEQGQETPGPSTASWVTQASSDPHFPSSASEALALPGDRSAARLALACCRRYSWCKRYRWPLNPCVRVNHKQVLAGLSVGRGTRVPAAQAQEDRAQGHGAPDGSTVPTCCPQPSALLSPLTLRIVTTVTAIPPRPQPHTHL